MKKYFEKREKLTTSVKNLINFVEAQKGLDVTTLGHFQNEIKELSFNVLCLGDFSSGKSTFVNNFFLEGKVKLPVKATTTTAKLTIIKYGETLKINASMKDGTLKEIKNDIENELNDLVAANGKGLNDIETVEVEIPSEVLKNGIVIVDSPGLNDPDMQRMDITLNFLKKADCILYFLNAQQAWKNTEKEFLEQEILEREDLDKIFFLLNYWDILEDEEEKEETLEYVENEIKKSLEVVKEKSNIEIDMPPLIPISAKTKENFDLLKEKLYSYLLNKEAQEILDGKIEKYNNFISSYIKQIEDQIKDIEAGERIHQLQQKELENEIKSFKEEGENRKEHLTGEVRKYYRSFVDGYKESFQNITDNFSSLMEKKIEDIDDEKKAEDSFKRALKTAILDEKPQLIKTQQELKEKVAELLNEELKNIDMLNVNLDNSMDVALNTDNTKDIVAGAGVVGVTASSVIATAATTTTGGFLGIGGTTVLASQGALAVVLTSPLVLGAAAVATGYYNFKKKKNFQKQLKDKIKDEYSNLRKKYSQQNKDLGDKTDEFVKLVTQNILNELDRRYLEKKQEQEEVLKMLKNKEKSITVLKEAKSQLRQQKI